MSHPTWDPRRWERVSALFNQALELPSEQREVFLQGLQGDDPDIAQSVARMLAADAEFATDTPPTPASALADAFDPVLAAGTQLGAYAIESCLGAGGMGRVYRARRIEGDVTQTVAIKCLRFRQRDPGFTRRFLRERRILAHLTHPNIARFLDVGTDTEGQPYVVIEYIDGVSITEFARNQRLSLRARIELLLKVMSAVAYSHRQLIVHRDIKPANVLVAANGEPQLLDFGIAKQLTSYQGSVAVDGETEFEHRAFSIGHAAPEQLRGEAVGTACDIYALGVLAYELICGQAPLALAGLSFAEAERRVLEVFPPPPSERLDLEAAAPDGSTGKGWRSALRGDLDNIVLHALKKEPNERYASVDAFSDDLRRCLDNEPISLRVGQRVYRVQRFVRRHRLAVALAASLLLALLVGSMALWRQNLATEVQRDSAIAQGRRAEALNGLLLDAFEAADPSRNAGRQASARDVLDQAARRLNNNAMDPATRVSLLSVVADVYLTLGLPQDSAAAAERATQLPGDVAALLHARAWRALAQARLALNEIPAAETALAFAATLPLDSADRSARAEAIERELVALKLLIAKGRAPEALDRYAILYARAQRELGPKDRLTLTSGATYAEQLRIMRRAAQSGALVKELLGGVPDAARDPLGVRLLGDLARFERDKKQMDLAVAHATEYAAGVRLLYGERHLVYASALDLLAKIERDSGRFDAAIAVHQEILEVLTTILGSPESPNQAHALNNYANTLRISGRIDAAVETARQSVQMALAKLPPGNPNIAHYRTTLAEALIDSGDFAGALAQLAESDALFAATQSANSPGVIRACGQVLRADALLGLGRRPESEYSLEQAWGKLRDLDPRAPCHEHALSLRRRLGSAVAPGTNPIPSINPSNPEP